MARLIDSTRIATTFTEFDAANEAVSGYGQVGDIVFNPVGDRLNSATWTNGDTALAGGTDIFSSSVQSASSGEYFIDVYQEDPTSNTSAEPQFAVAYGHFAGSGSTTLEGQSEGKTFSRAMYGQFAALLEDKQDADVLFNINGTNSTSSIFIDVYRNRMRERLDAGNWELHISGASGNKILKLVDNQVNSASSDMGDGPFSIISGTINDGPHATATEFGKFYPNYGTIVLDGHLVSASAPISLSYANLNYDGIGDGTGETGRINNNIAPIYNSLRGTGGYFQARSTENIHSRTYFCRIPNYKYNYSSNPTFTTGSQGALKHTTMVGNPRVYITTVGLYDENSELMAVARLSKPLLKSFEREALIRVRLEY